jgi:hypothetical protein
MWWKLPYTYEGRDEYGLASCRSVANLVQSLALCKSLRTFNLDLTVSTIFHEEFAELPAYFAGGALQSPGLETLANVLTSMPALRSLFIDGEALWRGVYQKPHAATEEAFLAFEYSGLREAIPARPTYRSTVRYDTTIRRR